MYNVKYLLTNKQNNKKEGERAFEKSYKKKVLWCQVVAHIDIKSKVFNSMKNPSTNYYKYI